MKKFILIIIFILIFQMPVKSDEAEDIQDKMEYQDLLEKKSPINPKETQEKTIWDYSRDDFVNNALLGNDSFFETKKQEKIDKELERLLNVKLVPITLEECLNIAMTRNYEIKSKSATERENYWYKKNAYTEFLPDVSYNYSLQRLSGTYLVGGIVTTRVQETAIQGYFNFSWDVFNKGRAFFNVSSRRSLHKASIYQKNYTRDEIILNTAISYYELLRCKAEVDIYATNVIDRKAQYDLTVARYKVGVGTKFDIYRSEAELAKAKQQYITAFNAIRIAQAKLANIIGIDVTVPIYPKEIVINEKQLLNADVDCLIDISKNTRQDILARKKEIDAMKAQRTGQYTDFIPDVKLNCTNARNGTVRVGRYPSNTFTLTVEAPLGDKLGLGTMTKIKAQSSAIKAAEYNLIQMMRDVEQEIIISNQNSESSKERVEASKKEVFASEKSLENSIVLMNAGVSTFIDVIQAQELKVNAQVRLAENITDYNIAQVQILFNSGLISVDNILHGVSLNLNHKTFPTP